MTGGIDSTRTEPIEQSAPRKSHSSEYGGMLRDTRGYPRVWPVRESLRGLRGENRRRNRAGLGGGWDRRAQVSSIGGGRREAGKDGGGFGSVLVGIQCRGAERVRVRGDLLSDATIVASLSLLLRLVSCVFLYVLPVAQHTCLCRPLIDRGEGSL